MEITTVGRILNKGLREGTARVRTEKEVLGLSTRTLPLQKSVFPKVVIIIMQVW